MEPPIRLLEKALNTTIIIRLKDNRELEGRLKSADSYMNLELTNATERDQEGNKIVKYGELFLRGNNILFVRLEI
ncbi:MAG: LSM domain-containing protein [Candidatus Hodarchaeota archaeon]